ncbi:MAG: cyclodeaminase/cyclohydrolase family protein [Ardenticatenia bacterium]|nr:cyclodeaminase/cyclohydrolase family protein [Ardenticatenia bacterium]
MRTQTVGTFLDELASANSAPGGGAASALAGAMGAALVAMVAQLTLGRKKYAQVEDEMRRLLARAEAARAELTKLADLDAEVFNRVMEAYRMPKGTEVERAERARAIQAALKDATHVPLRVAEQAVHVLALAQEAADKGNVNVISDAGAGVVLADAALEMAALNVAINLALIEDEEFSREARRQLEAYRAERDRLKAPVLETVYRRIGGS